MREIMRSDWKPGEAHWWNLPVRSGAPVHPSAYLHAENLSLLWQAMQLTRVQSTPHGITVAFIVSWHLKQ